MDGSHFFDGTLMVFVGEGASAAVRSDLEKRLKDLGFSFEVLECDQSWPVSIYHRGDMITGARLSHFFDYADRMRSDLI